MTTPIMFFDDDQNKILLAKNTFLHVTHRRTLFSVRTSSMPTMPSPRNGTTPDSELKELVTSPVNDILEIPCSHDTSVQEKSALPSGVNAITSQRGLRVMNAMASKETVSGVVGQPMTIMPEKRTTFTDRAEPITRRMVPGSRHTSLQDVLAELPSPTNRPKLRKSVLSAMNLPDPTFIEKPRTSVRNLKQCTTLCLGRLPYKMNTHELMEQFQFRGVNFVWLPINFKRFQLKKNMGFAIVNFESHELAAEFMQAYAGTVLAGTQRELPVNWATQQGLDECLAQLPSLWGLPSQCYPFVWDNNQRLSDDDMLTYLALRE